MGEVNRGSGDGSGSGSGSGYGDGDGDGSGSGSGYGLKEAVRSFISMLPSERAAHARKLLKKGAKFAYWKSGPDARPCNGGEGSAVKVGTIQSFDGPLNPCKAGALHATYRLNNWKGTRVWLVAMSGEVKEVDDDKLAATKREIIAELTDGKIV